MIKPLTVELKILIYIIAYGVYYFAISDLLIFLEEKLHFKKIKKIFVEFIYLITQIFITYNFCYKLDSGYLPIYFLLFIIIGFLLYYLFMRDYYIKTLTVIIKIIFKITPFLNHLIYSKTLIKKIFSKLKHVLIKFRIFLRKKTNNINNKNQNT